MTDRIDSHHHLWQYSELEFGWISDQMQPLRRDFLVSDLTAELAAAGVQGTVAVQARQSLEETRWLLQCAGECPGIRGVVGWAPLASPDFERELEELVTHPRLKGLRHVLQDEPDDRFMLGDGFNRGIEALSGANLVYDILIYERHLPIAAQFVDRHPDQLFVLDHLAKPLIRKQQLDPWRENVRQLASRPNVSCKVSGMVTEADWQRWSIDDLRPYFETALQCFGPERLLAGSDWPVCLLGTSYSRWWQTLAELAGELSTSEQEAILGGNAMRIYRLEGGNSTAQVSG